MGTGLPFRILPRSFSHVYKSKTAANDNIVVENVRAFYPLYVFAREELDLSNAADPQGWYQISESAQGPPIGWMKARDVLEWRQALVVAYTHPGTPGEERQRVLMFRSKEDLKAMLSSSDFVSKAMNMYQRLHSGEVASGLISKEPEGFVDINRTFYLLPILDFETIDLQGDEARLLQLAAAVPSKRGADTLENRDYLKEAMHTPRLSGNEALGVGIDIVFIMDMTKSMGPYIEDTKQATAEIARRIVQDRVKDKIRFGLVGYRDDVSKTPALEFTSKNFTPELVNMDTFVAILGKEAHAIQVSSVGYSEEVFAGAETGLASKWNANSLRFMILVGDASSHPVGHQQNTTGKDATVLRLAAEEAQIHILAIHLQDPQHPEDHAVAKRQYATLSRIRGKAGESAMVQIGTDDKQTFQTAVEAIAEEFSDILARIQAGNQAALGGSAASTAGGADEPAPVTTARKLTREIAAAALVEYLGREASPPKDITVWALDRDLIDPSTRALDVRILLNKQQLSDLIVALDRVISVMNRDKMSQMQFFDALQGLAGQAMKNPEAIEQSPTLAETGLLPAFVRSLPYKSEILSLTAEMFVSMTAEERAALERSLSAKLNQYHDINEQVDGWVRLNDADPMLHKVYPLHLDYLP
jgi:hypothetical protein